MEDILKGEMWSGGRDENGKEENSEDWGGRKEGGRSDEYWGLRRKERKKEGDEGKDGRGEGKEKSNTEQKRGSKRWRKVEEE